MEFFGFILVHTVKKEDSEKCQTREGLKDVELTNVANFLLEEPTTIEHFISQHNLDKVAIEHSEKGLDFFIECLTLRNAEGTKIFKEGEHAGKPISQMIEEELVSIADHVAMVVQLP